MDGTTPSGDRALLACKGAAAPVGMVTAGAAALPAAPLDDRAGGAAPDAAPAHNEPTQNAPGQTAPRHTVPRQTAPRQTAPGHTAPGQSAPGQSAPGQSATSEAAAGDSAPPAASLLPSDFVAARFREAEEGNLFRLQPAASESADASAGGAAAVVPLQVEPHGEAPAARPRSSLGLGALAAAVALVAVAGLAVWRLSAPQPAPLALREAPAPSSAEAPNLLESVTRTASPTAASPTAAPPPGGAPESIPRAGSGATGAAAPAPDSESTGGSPVADVTGKMPDGAAAMTPSVDIVDLRADGSLVIAGRAAPGSELIVLDGGAPIGTAEADSLGEWGFVADRPLPRGEHAFGVVIKEVYGTVRLPAPDSKLPPPIEPAAIEREESRAPLPPRKPEGALAAVDPAFVVQLASVKTRDGAMQEWAKLRARFPELLADKKLTLDETELQGRGRVVRVRAGPFANLRGASDFCADIAAGRQDCLVVRLGGR